MAAFAGGESRDQFADQATQYHQAISFGPVAHWFPHHGELSWLSYYANLRYGQRKEGLRLSVVESPEALSTRQYVITGDVAVRIALFGRAREVRGFSALLGVSWRVPLDGPTTVHLSRNTLEVMSSDIEPYCTFNYGFAF